MRAFFCKNEESNWQWRIATCVETRKIPDNLTILNVPINANDAALLKIVKKKNPTEKLLTYLELTQ